MDKREQALNAYDHAVSTGEGWEQAARLLFKVKRAKPRKKKGKNQMLEAHVMFQGDYDGATPIVVGFLSKSGAIDWERAAFLARRKYYVDSGFHWPPFIESIVEVKTGERVEPDDFENEKYANRSVKFWFDKYYPYGVKLDHSAKVRNVRRFNDGETSDPGRLKEA